MTLPVVDHGPSLSVPVGDAVPGSGPPTPPNPVPASVADITAAVQALVAGAPGAFDTLGELAAGKDALQRVVTPAVTASGALAVNKLTPVDATAGPVAMTLPTGQAEGTQIAVAKVDNTTNAVTVTGNIRSTAAQTVSLALYREGILFRADSAGSWWPISDHKTLSSLDSRFLKQTDASGTYVALGQAGRQAADAQFAAALRPFHVALSNIDTANVNCLFLGDSTIEGATATSVNYFLSSRFAQIMRRKYQSSSVVGGYGYIPARYAYTAPADKGVTDTVGGGIATNYGIGRRNLVFSGAGQTVTFTFTGTGFDIFYRTDPSLGTFTYTVDGGSAVTITPTAANGTAKVRVTGLTVGAHTVVLARATATTVVTGLVALNGDETTGLRVYEGGHSGYKTSDYTTGSWVDDVGLIQPSLVYLGLILNDYGAGTTTQPLTSAQVQTNLGTLMTNIAAKCTISPTFVVEAPQYPNNALTGTPEAYANYVAAVYAAVAARSDALVFDFYQRVNSSTTPSLAGGLISADMIHPSNAGYRYKAEALAALVSPR